jgi:DNA-binding MarR family transcriptional regulator
LKGALDLDTVLHRKQPLHQLDNCYIIKILENQDIVKGIVMISSAKTDLKRKALLAVRDYGVNLTLFRNAMSVWQGMNPIDMDSLRFLFLKGISTPSEVSRYTGLTSGATTALLDRLEKAGFIERQPNPDDRRGTLIVAAKGAAEKVAGWFASARKAQDELLASYSEAELELIAEVFERFAQLWQQETEKMRKEQ